MVALMILTIAASKLVEGSSYAPVIARMMIPGIQLYTLLSIWFISMGIGSIRARRWARALVLVSSWIWLVAGLNALIVTLLLLPDMYEKMAETRQMPQETAVVMKYVMTGFLAIVYVIIPGALVLFYGSKNVKETCELRDPQLRWTDKCPLPVLALTLLFGVWTLALPLTGFYGWAVPFFGRILTGIAGAGVALFAMVLSAYAAWGTYRLHIKAWWCSVLLVVAWSLSVTITFSHVTMWEYYEKMNFPEQQLDLIKQAGMPQGSTMALLTGLWVILFVGYLLYTKRYFQPLPEAERAS